MLIDLKKKLHQYISETIQSQYAQEQDIPTVELETPADKKHGEFSCNIALKSAKSLKKSPLDIAKNFQSLIESGLEQSALEGKFDRIEVKKPGFINFFLSPAALYDVLYEVFEKNTEYGKLDFGKGEKIQIEFVSANPTGPLSVAHARQAAVGDALGNILKFIGFDVTKEYYINDGGNQINKLGESVKCRAGELLGQEVEFPEDGYQGDYIRDMAKIFLDEHQIETPVDLDKVDQADFNHFGATYLLNVIKSDLHDFGVHFDQWSHESKVANEDHIKAILKFLKEKEFLYEKDGALWFRTTDFNDDKDRVIQKSDGSYTYLTPDIVYHKNKFDRGFSRVFNIWGPDHHGYIPRIKAAAQALGKNADDLEVLIVQLATIYRDGKAVSMSTRKGEFISLREVMDEVGVDAARFFFLMRHISAHLDFDLELAKKQSSDNPVYYIQYAHARVYSINGKAHAQDIHPKEDDLSLIVEKEELELIRVLGDFYDALLFCYQQRDPCPLVNYLHDLATHFHKFYDKHKVVDESNKELSAQRLALANAVRIVIANGLHLLGLSAPKSM